MPHILMIATGGTIACCETAHGLSPALDSAALLGALPELSALCTVETPVSYTHLTLPTKLEV